MQNTIDIIKKYKFQIAMIVLAIIILGFAFFVNSLKKTAFPSVSPSPTPKLADSSVGGNLGALVSEIGRPIEGSIPQNGPATYNSESGVRKHEVIYKKSEPVFFKQIVSVQEAKTGKSLRTKFGEPEMKLFGPTSEFGDFLFAYPTKGIAYVAGEITDNVSEVWYFKPIDSQTFLKTWAIDYSTTPLQEGF